MDFDATAKELLRALRGDRSQAAFSRRLGYRANVVHAWEAGRRWPSASETFRVAGVAGIDRNAALGRFYRTPPAWLAEADLSSPAFVARFLQDQQGRVPAAAIARRAGINRYSVARWLAGDAEPRLPDFLRLVEATSLRLVDLLAALVDPGALPAIAATWARLDAQRRIAIDAPWAMAVLRCLEVSELGGDATTIADRLGLGRPEIDRCLDALRGAGLAARVEARWHPVAVDAVDTRRSPETARRLKGFWARVGADRVVSGSDGAFAYNLASVSMDQLRRLHRLHDEYFQAARAIVAEGSPPECVVLMNLQLLRLDDRSGTVSAEAGDASSQACP